MCFQSLMRVSLSLSLGARLQRERPCVALSFVREGVVGPSVCGVSEPRRRGGGRPCVALELSFWGVLRCGPRSAELIASDREVRDFVVGRAQGRRERLGGPGGRRRGRDARPQDRRRARARSELRFRLFLDGFPITDAGLSLSLDTRLQRERPCVTLSFVRGCRWSLSLWRF